MTTKVILYFFAAYFFLTGVYIFLAPETFYRLTPGLSDMGPYNFHFVRDISFIFLVSAGAIAYGAARQNKAVIVCGAAWPFLHALFHTQIWAHRGFPFDHIWRVDTVAVILPGLIILWLAVRFKYK